MSEEPQPWGASGELPDDLAAAMSDLRQEQPSIAQLERLTQNVAAAALSGAVLGSASAVQAAEVAATGVGQGAGATSALGTTFGGAAKLAIFTAAVGLIAYGGATWESAPITEAAPVVVAAPERPVEVPEPVADIVEEQSPEPERPVRRRRRRSRRRAAAEVVAPTPAPAPVLEVGPSEVELLLRARRALERNPRATLAMVEEHQDRFRMGVLAEEREVVRIDALMRLGRRDPALRRARRFLAAHPRSIHRQSVESLMAAAAEPTETP